MADDGAGGTSPLVVAIVAMLSALIGAGATLGVAYFTFASKDQELKVHLVEIAVSILRADPKEDVAGAREWALDVMAQKSGVKFSPEDRQALLHKPLAGKAAIWEHAGLSDFADWLDAMRKQAGGMPAPDKLTPAAPAEGK
jgi:hypothetical protein